MNICEIEGLYVAYNKSNDFRILVVASDKLEASQLAVNYFFESHFENYDDIEVTEFSDTNIRFDCDYVIA